MRRAPTQCSHQRCPVSIHAPREGCDPAMTLMMAVLLSFNSRTPGGVRPPCIGTCRLSDDVSIHAPREGCDGITLQAGTSSGKFQFTHPGRGATARAYTKVARVYVSIHAPREGCDLRSGSRPTFPMSFNSRTPGGVRQPNKSHRAMDQEFQFTHPGRGATASSVLYSSSIYVSIHAPREGCDSMVQSCLLWGG